MLMTLLIYSSPHFILKTLAFSMQFGISSARTLIFKASVNLLVKEGEVFPKNSENVCLTSSFVCNVFGQQQKNGRQKRNSASLNCSRQTLRASG